MTVFVAVWGAFVIAVVVWGWLEHRRARRRAADDSRAARPQPFFDPTVDGGHHSPRLSAPEAPPREFAPPNREVIEKHGAEPGCYLCKMGVCGRHQRDAVRDRERAEALRASLPQVSRPWHPEAMMPTSDGDRPECFGHHGYGDGLLGDGRCSNLGCPLSDLCYGIVRQIAEGTSERVRRFSDHHAQLARELRAQGATNPGAQAMEQLQREGADLPLEDVYRMNHELGRLDSGDWGYCSDCDLVVRLDRLDHGRCPRCAQRLEEAHA